MAVTVKGGFDIESAILQAATGRDLNPGKFKASASIPNFDFVTTTIELDDPTLLESYDQLNFTASQLPRPQVGILASRVLEDGSFYDDYRITGLALEGDANSIIRLAFVDSIFYEPGTDEFLPPNADLLESRGGADFDKYLVKFDIHPDYISPLTWNTNEFLRAAFELRLGDRRAFDAFMSRENFNVTGSELNDSIRTYGGKDVISGGGGENHIDPGAGDDLILLGAGADTVEVSEGYDTVRVSKSSSANWIKNQFSGDIFNDVFAPQAFERYEGSSQADDFSMPLGLAKDFTLLGKGGDDTLGGGSRNDRILGGAGADTLRGNQGNDVLDGGADNDTAYFDDHFGDFSKGWTINLDKETATTRSKGNLFVLVAAETDTLKSIENVIASNGNDRVTGNASNNDMDGLKGVDTISFADHFGGQDQGWSINMILGVADAKWSGEVDTFRNFENLIGSKGNDTIQSAEGRITLANQVPLSIPTVDGGGGKDTLKLAPTISDSVAVLSNFVSAADDAVVFSTTGEGRVETATNIRGSGSGPLSGITRPATGHLKFKNIEVLDTSAGRDSVTGSSGADQVILGDGDDVASMGAGDDIVTGGAGVDKLTGGAGKDQFRYTKATDGGDTIADFRLGDEVAFASAGFNNLKKGALSAVNFASNAAGTARQADDFFIFKTGDNSLWFDADGSGTGAAIKIADFSNNYSLTANDILVV